MVLYCVYDVSYNTLMDVAWFCCVVEWLRNHGEKHMMHSKPGVKTPNKSTIYSPPPGSGSLKMTAWE